MINNYKDFKKMLDNLDYRPKLLLHSCCAPCSSHVITLLNEYFDIERIIVSTYQAVSGAGVAGMEELYRQSREVLDGKEPEAKTLPCASDKKHYPIAFNCIPQVDKFDLDNHFSKEDFMYASLYNNWALAYQESTEYEKAAVMLRKSLNIVDLYKDAMIPQATTRTNLASSLLGIGTEAAYTEAVKHLSKALDIFEKDGGKDFHYGAALVAMGDAYSYKEDYVKAVKYYEAGMAEVEKQSFGNMISQLNIEENDYINVLANQRDRIAELESELLKIKEKNRAKTKRISKLEERLKNLSEKNEEQYD